DSADAQHHDERQHASQYHSFVLKCGNELRLDRRGDHEDCVFKVADKFTAFQPAPLLNGILAIT
ncbi:hypothetical protein, partial [Methylocaldum sp.]|uniref:hypothetical protein n=1 Tax=Methylocaldum sp. TaxID=1969727 RepID=UPI003220910A